MPVGELDRNVGMLEYATSHPGLGGIIRSRIEDFQVEELVTHDLLRRLSPSASGRFRYGVLELSKRGIDTLHACSVIGKALHRRVYYLGLKDSRALAKQFVSIKEPPPDRISNVADGAFSLQLLGYAQAPFRRRDLLGNSFRIIVRNIQGSLGQVQEVMAEVSKKASEFNLPNFFGYQRFGSRRPVTHLVGREIVKANPKAAVENLLTFGTVLEEVEVKESRRAVEGGRVGSAAELTSGLDVESIVASQLSQKPGDFWGALRSVPIEVRRLFVNAYQSYLFNLALSEALGEGELHKWMKGDFVGKIDCSTGLIRDVEVAASDGSAREGNRLPLLPLPGYAYRDGEGRFRCIMKRVLREENVTPRSFFVKGLEEVSVSGDFRPACLFIRELSTAFPSEDGSLMLEMCLPKGSYATVVLREVMKPSDPFAAGF